MVMKQDIQKKRVKDLEPGDRIRLAGLVREVARQENGVWRFYEIVEGHRRILMETLGANSMQWVELVENSKEI
jgi:hypothetical protein